MALLRNLKIDPKSLGKHLWLVDATPVVEYTKSGERTDKIIGFECGADDYLTKPFNILELKARVRALLRRAGAAQQQRSGNELAAGAVFLTLYESTRALQPNIEHVRFGG